MGSLALKGKQINFLDRESMNTPNILLKKKNLLQNSFVIVEKHFPLVWS